MQSGAAMVFGGSAAKDREPSGWKWEKMELERELRNLRKKLEDSGATDSRPSAAPPAAKDGAEELKKAKQMLVEKEAELVDKRKNINDLLERLKVKDAEAKNARMEMEKSEEKLKELSRKVVSIDVERKQLHEATERLERERGELERKRRPGENLPRGPPPSGGEAERLVEEVARLKDELNSSSRQRNIERYDLQKTINEKVKVIEENKVTINWLRGEMDKLKGQVSRAPDSA